ncbi:MAG TPA: YqgE/AlgH family protein [Chromatiales bacterium]|nr:YqgE/AlgH family protein [Chromatiales bacterium]
MGKCAGLVLLLLAGLAVPAGGLANVGQPGFAYFSEQPRAGKFLVASRKMRFTRFRETVIFLTRHDERGTVGVVVNRPYVATEIRARDARVPGLSAWWHLYAGGPVEPWRYSILLEASSPYLNKGHDASNLMFFSGAENVMRFTSRHVRHGSHRVFSGYAGWYPGQLMKEIRLGAWHVLPGDTRLVFDSHPSLLWQRMIRRALME